MATISIRNIYLDMMKKIGQVDSIVEEAVKKYLIDKCVERIEKANTKIKEFEILYNCSFSDFIILISHEEQLEKIEKGHPSWEGDHAEWEYWQKELDEWKAKLESILMRS